MKKELVHHLVAAAKVLEKGIRTGNTGKVPKAKQVFDVIKQALSLVEPSSFSQSTVPQKETGQPAQRGAQFSREIPAYLQKASPSEKKSSPVALSEFAGRKLEEDKEEPGFEPNLRIIYPSGNFVDVMVENILTGTGIGIPLADIKSIEYPEEEEVVFMGDDFKEEVDEIASLEELKEKYLAEFGASDMGELVAKYKKEDLFQIAEVLGIEVTGSPNKSTLVNLIKDHKPE